jgi:hypothetical protein
MRRITGADFRAANQQEPGFVDRVTVCWQLLFSADQVVKKLKAEDLPARPGVPWFADGFADLIGAPLAGSLAAALLDRLRLGAEGEFLKHYWVFLKSIARIRSKPSSTMQPLPTPLSGKALQDDGLRRVAWWLIRSRRERYVEFLAGTEAPYLHVHFGHVVGQVYREMVLLCGEAVSRAGDSRAIVEQEINGWLRYGGLDVGESSGPANEADQSPEMTRDLVRAFSETNRLSQKLIVAAEQGRSQADGELEAQLRQYAAENTALEERNRALELELASSSRPPAGTEAPATPSPESSGDLRDLVRLIDAKYSLDLLKGIQLGNESPLTLRSFVSHVLYALTKKGLVPYPADDRFVLSYEKSGLFECDGFEVKPGDTAAVAVVRRGWALQAKDRLLPVRKARVEQVPPEGVKQ